MEEQKKPNQMTQTLIMVVLVSVTAWAAMTFTQNRNQAEYQKQSEAGQTQKQDAASQAEQAPATAPAATGTVPAVTDPDGQSKDPAQDSPLFVIDQCVKKFDGMKAYSATFDLLQPRNSKETEKPDLLKKLTETFEISWKKNSGNSPDKDAFRLEGINGFNRCTVAGYSPAAQKFSVFHPSAKPMTVPAEDMRLRDLYETGIHIVADHVRRVMIEPGSAVSMRRETMRLPGQDEPREYFRITITKKDGAREIATINTKTFALEMHELYHFNKKGKTDSQRYWLGRSLVWSGFKSGTPHGDDWYIRKPDFKKLHCSR